MVRIHFENLSFQLYLLISNETKTIELKQNKLPLRLVRFNVKANFFVVCSSFQCLSGSIVFVRKTNDTLSFSLSTAVPKRIFEPPHMELDCSSPESTIFLKHSQLITFVNTFRMVLQILHSIPEQHCDWHFLACFKKPIQTLKCSTLSNKMKLKQNEQNMQQE